jgi:ABC-type multidrug transport system fused ATPase/permease subunit
MMIVAAGIVLVLVNPRLALYTAVAMPPITVLALRFARRVSPLSRQVQERKEDVTEAADEAVVGIEMVQAFGREDDVRGRFGGKAEAVRDTVLRQAGVEARHLPGLYCRAAAGALRGGALRLRRRGRRAARARPRDRAR